MDVCVFAGYERCVAKFAGRIFRVGRDGGFVGIKFRDLRLFAGLMHQHWERKKSRSQGMSNDRIPAEIADGIGNATTED